MKKIDLYEIAIKILGLYLIVVIIGNLQTLLNLIPFFFYQDNNQGDVNRIPVFLVLSAGLIVLILFACLLIFRTKQVARIITKPTDNEEYIKLFAERKTIYEICLVLLGLIIIVWTLPDFIFQLKNYVTFVQNNIPFKNYDKIFLITSGIKIVVGIVAVTCAVPVADLLTKKKH